VVVSRQEFAARAPHRRRAPALSRYDRERRALAADDVESLCDDVALSDHCVSRTQSSADLGRILTLTRGGDRGLARDAVVRADQQLERALAREGLCVANRTDRGPVKGFARDTRSLLPQRHASQKVAFSVSVLAQCLRHFQDYVSWFQNSLGFFGFLSPLV